MISRRALRIRSFQFLFSYFKQNINHSDTTSLKVSIETIKKQCLQSLDKSYYFYLLVLSLLDEFRILELNEFEKDKYKYIQKKHQRVPVFSTNPFLMALSQSKEFHQKLNQYQVNFGKDKDWTVLVYKAIKKDEIYLEYIKKAEHSFHHALIFIEDIVSDVLYYNELVESFFEENSQFAQDDLYLSMNMVIKNIYVFSQTKSFKVLPQYKDPSSDKKFLYDLLDYTVQNYDAFDAYIAKYSENWDIDRMNYTDLLLLKMCMVEIIYMPDIPLKAIVDEYLEISKDYSTPQSYAFINGILVGLIKDLKEKGLIQRE